MKSQKPSKPKVTEAFDKPAWMREYMREYRAGKRRRTKSTKDVENAK